MRERVGVGGSRVGCGARCSATVCRGVVREEEPKAVKEQNIFVSTETDIPGSIFGHISGSYFAFAILSSFFVVKNCSKC